MLGIPLKVHIPSYSLKSSCLTRHGEELHLGGRLKDLCQQKKTGDIELLDQRIAT
jgi:hypothetical protein